jgi:hypothetical protein
MRECLGHGGRDAHQTAGKMPALRGGDMPVLPGAAITKDQEAGLRVGDFSAVVFDVGTDFFTTGVF